MDLIAISDIYGNQEVLKDLLSKISGSCENRVIIIAGDIDVKASHGYSQSVDKIFSRLSKECEYVLYIPGDSDSKDLVSGFSNVINIDERNHVVEMDGVKVGFFGLGGAPEHSVRPDEPLTYLWNENIPIIRQGLMTNLRIQLEKVMIERPDYLVLVTHSPPYGIADYSTPITLKEIVVLEEIYEESIAEEHKKEETDVKRPSRNPRRLGSRMLREFVESYKPDLHIFGHVHKQGGKTAQSHGTSFFNISHLSPIPYKLTGRKFLSIEITRKGITSSFDSVVLRNLPFPEFLETYL